MPKNTPPSHTRAARRRVSCAPNLFESHKIVPLLGFAVGMALLVLLGGCGSGSGEGQGAHAQATNGERRGPTQPPVPVAVVAASTGPIASYYAATATLAAEKQAELLARVNGVALERFCEEGDFVTEGQTLLRIEDAQYRLQVRQAEASTLRLRDRHDRVANMREQDLVSAEEYETVKNELAAAEAAEALARLELSYTKVVAPFSGHVVTRHVDVGQNITSGLPLFVLADFDPMLAIVHVPAKEFKKLRKDQPVDVVLDSNKERMQGRIKLISPIIDPNSGTIKVTVEIEDYPPETRPGDFAQVSIVTERRTGRTLVPKIAVFTDRGDQIVYVAADSTAERRVVEVGFQDDANAEIVSGLESGEPVVVKGQRSLKHGSPLKIMNEEAPTAARTETQAGS